MTTVLASGVVSVSIGPVGLFDRRMSADVGETATVRSQLNLTSSVVIARPFVGGRWSNAWLLRSLYVTCSPSGETSHDSAASPEIVSGPGSSLIPRPYLTSV